MDVISEISGYKLFTIRCDGSLGPLFINRRQRLSVGGVYPAESFPTKGYAFRPGWHAVVTPEAPHLSSKGRVWARVTLRNAIQFNKPKSQGGVWLLAEEMRIDALLDLNGGENV